MRGFVAAGLAALTIASCGPRPPTRDRHGCTLDATYDCAEMCFRADLGRCPAWIGSDLTKPGVCVESCRGVGPERLHCRLFADTCADAYFCYSMLQ